MSKPLLIDQPNLSLAWAEAYLAVRSASEHRVSPLVVSFAGLDEDEAVENEAIRHALDEAISSPMPSVQTVANTIFPQILWRQAKGDRHAFYKAYRENLPDYVSMCTQNKRGLYFGRLTAFGLDHRTGDYLPQFPKGSLAEDGNQIEVIIKQCKKGTPAIKLQASVFDPGRDHVREARLGFPCLQHVTFIPSFSDGTLTMNAFYATQQLFMRGYGNYLGLARLGMFVAKEVGLSLDRVSCFIGVEKMDTGYMPKDKKRLRLLDDACEAALEGAASPGGTD